MIEQLKNKKPVFYKNVKAAKDPKPYLNSLSITYEDIVDANKRLMRFAPIIQELFPECRNGIIESPLLEVNRLKKGLLPMMKGRLYIKLDSHLDIAGSIKARGGIYEVLKVCEDLLSSQHMSVQKASVEEIRECMAPYTMSVASTGNLGLSIGIMSSALGFKAEVHMSEEAKEWKKERLRKRGVRVIEYKGDFTYAAKCAREKASHESMTHFVDDENSKNLFLGYAVSALRIEKQFEKLNISIDEKNKLHLYLPCGVGGSPGGITFGFKHVFGKNVKCYFAEPTNCPSMLLGVMTGRFGEVNVNEYGISNQTSLDGLAVASPSNFVAPLMEKLCDGFYTVNDEDMFKDLYYLKKYEDIQIEPSAAAGIRGVKNCENLDDPGYHIIWTTGGIYVPDEIYGKMYRKGEGLCQQK